MKLRKLTLLALLIGGPAAQAARSVVTIEEARKTCRSQGLSQRAEVLACIEEKTKNNPKPKVKPASKTPEAPPSDVQAE